MPRPLILRRLLSVSLACGGALAVAGPALGAGWMPAQGITPTGINTSAAQVRFTPSGQAVADWTFTRPGEMYPYADATTWNRGGGWAPDDERQAAFGDGTNAAAVDDEGTLFVTGMATWPSGTGVDGVSHRQRTAAGAWIPPENPVMLGREGQVPYATPSYKGYQGVGYRGEACVLYGGDNGAARLVYRTRRLSTPSTWSTPVGGISAVPASAVVALIARGDGCTAAWWGSNNRIEVRDFGVPGRAASSGWSGPGSLGAGGPRWYDPQLAADEAGKVTLTWTSTETTDIEGSGPYAWHRVWMSERTSGTWSAPRRVTPFNHDPWQPSLDVSSDGSAVLGWLHRNHVWVMTRPPGGAWSSPQQLSPDSHNARDLDVAAGDGGSAAVVWTRMVYDSSGNDTKRRVPVASVRGPGAAWGEPVSLAGEQARIGDPSQFGITAAEIGIDVTPQGDAVAVWSNGGVQARFYDGTPPSLTPIQGAGSGGAGDALTFRAIAADDLSGLASGTLWSFGDGTWATGDEVSHRYDAAGTYTVTAEARDNQGNVTRRTHSVTVSPAPAAPSSPAGGSPPPASNPGPSGQTQGTAPSLRLAGAITVTQRWTGKTLRARVQAPLNVTKAQQATVTVRATGGVAVRLDPGIRGRQVLARRVVLRQGAMRLVTVLPATLDPGRYRLDIAGAEGTTVARTFVIGNPAVGILAGSPTAKSSSRRNGFVWARFRWAVKPSARARITTEWIGPPGTPALGQQSRDRRSTTFSRVQGRVKKGQWRCILRVNGVVMAVARTRV